MIAKDCIIGKRYKIKNNVGEINIYKIITIKNGKVFGKKRKDDHLYAIDLYAIVEHVYKGHGRIGQNEIDKFVEYIKNKGYYITEMKTYHRFIRNMKKFKLYWGAQQVWTPLRKPIIDIIKHKTDKKHNKYQLKDFIEWFMKTERE